MFCRKKWICVLLVLIVLLSGCRSGEGHSTSKGDTVTLWLLTEVYWTTDEGDKFVYRSYEYDENGLMMAKMRNDETDVEKYSYDENGNCVSWELSYNNENMAHFKPMISDYTYDYDNKGRATAMYNQEGSLLQEYQYYRNGNLKEVGLDKGDWGWHYLFNEVGYPTELELRNMERNLIDGMQPSMEEVTYTYSLYREEYEYEDNRLVKLSIYKMSGPTTEAYNLGKLSQEYVFNYDDGKMTEMVCYDDTGTAYRTYPAETDSHGNVLTLGSKNYTYEKITIPKEDAIKLIGNSVMRTSNAETFHPLDYRIQYRIEE